jgi:hypothetical protein
MSWPGGWIDPELEELFHNEPELLETAKRVRAARPQVDVDPRFQNRLRAQLVAEASRGGARRGVRRWWNFGPAHAAWGGAAVGAILITATVLTFVSNHPQDQTVTAFSQLTAQHSVSPNQVITVAFNQPMDQQAVEAGVHIQPATKVSYSWQHNNLVITPAYHLSGNTPYSVTIAQTALRALSGASAAAPIHITFGTAPTPPPTPVATPSLIGGNLGTNAASGGALLFEPNGTVVSTAAVLPPSSIPSSTPGASPTPTGTGASSAPASGAGSLVAFPASGSPLYLGEAPSALAFTADGFTLATAVGDANGGSRIAVSQSDGTQRRTLTHTTTPVTALTWSGDQVVYTDGTTINSVDLSKRVQPLYSLASGTGTITALAPGGAYAYVAPPLSGTGGSLLDIATGGERVLKGAATDVAFSGDGKTIAWVDGSGPEPGLLVEPLTQSDAASVSLPGSAASVSGVALNQAGGEIAYVMTDSSGATQVVVAQLPGGAPLAIGSPASPSELALSPSGNRVAFVSTSATGPAIEVATVTGATTDQGAQVPPAADFALQRFVQAQVGTDGQSDVATLAALSAPGVDATSGTPQNLSRAYVISTYLAGQGNVGANIELIVDPNAGHTTARVASERLLLAPSASGYLVTSVQTAQLGDETFGPHVVQVTSETLAGVTTLQVSFDSDLNALTVAGAITIFSGSGVPLNAATVYNPDSRTATVTIVNAPKGTFTLDIATTLADFNGQSLARTFDTQVAASS